MKIRLGVFALAFLLFMTIYIVRGLAPVDYRDQREVANEFLHSFGYTDRQIVEILDGP